MTLPAILVYCYLSLPSLASTIPLQRPEEPQPQPLTLTPTLNLTSTLATRTGCFVQSDQPGAYILYETSLPECRAAYLLLPEDEAINEPYTFGRGPDADVRLPRAKTFQTCKILIDIPDEAVTDRLTWRGIWETLEAPRGVLRNCLGQFPLPPLGGTMSVGEKDVMRAVVEGLAPTAGAVAST